MEQINLALVINVTQVGLFKIVSPNLNINIYSIKEKTLRKTILCGWRIVRSQEKFLHG